MPRSNIGGLHAGKQSGGVAYFMGKWFQMVPLGHLQSPCDKEGIPEWPHIPGVGGGQGKRVAEKEGTSQHGGHSVWENRMDW